LVVRDTRPRSDRASGRGLEAQPGTSVELHRAAFERNRDVGLFATGGGTSVLLEDVVVRETLPRLRDGTRGLGVQAQDGAMVDIRRSAVERNGQVGMAATGAGTVLLVSDVVVRDTQGLGTGANGRGLELQDGARVEVRRTLLHGNREFAVFAAEAGTSVLLEDVLIRDTAAQPSDGEFGRGVSAQSGAEVRVRRAVLVRNVDAALAVFGAGSSLRVEDAVVLDTQSAPTDGLFGAGVLALDGGRFELQRGLFRGNHHVALFAADPGTVLVAEDLQIVDTQGRAVDGQAGHGLELQLGAQAELRRATFERNREASLMVIHPGTTLAAEDLAVRDTLEADCPTCPGRGGIGVGLYGGGTGTLARFAVGRSALCGLQLATAADPLTGLPYPDSGTIDLQEGEVAENPIGVNLQAPDFDVARLTDRVLYRDNDRNLDTDTLPVPDTVEPPP
jgi:hypothetical protein